MNHRIILAGLCVLLAAAGTARAQNTTFTYQGRLNSAAGAATGLYDLSFNLYATSEGGSALAVSNGVVAVPVTNGFFTVALNFGSSLFTGADRWLEIAVRTNGAGPYAVLAPRQPLTPTPYAIRAISAGTAATAGTATNVVASGITGASIATNVVDSSKIMDGTITATDLSTTLLSNTFWRLLGNAGTTQGVHFLGTTDNQVMELRANNTTALRMSRINTTAVPNLIGGFGGNFVVGGWQGAVIGGGGGAGNTNRILSGNATTISGGSGNTVSGEGAVVAGGVNNQVMDTYGGIGGGLNNSVLKNDSFIGGGIANSVSGDRGVIAGGRDNAIRTNASNASIAGGRNNIVTGSQGTIPGGSFNEATNNAFAAGTRARAVRTGSFVWADSQNSDFASTANDQFIIRAAGGVGIGTNSPQENLHLAGKFLRVDGLGDERAYLGGDGIGGEVQVGSLNSAINSVLLWNAGNNTTMDLIADQVTASQFNGPLNGSLSGTFSGGVSASSLKLGNSSTAGSVLAATDGSGNAGWSDLIHQPVSRGTLPNNAVGSVNFRSGTSINSIGGGVIGATLLGGGRAPQTAGPGAPASWPNSVNADFATVVGGASNVASGVSSFVAGGFRNNAGGPYSFAAGQRAKANDQGAFVWADSQNSDFASSGNNQFLIRAGGGVGINTSNPQSALDVNGDGTVRGNLVLDGNNANNGGLYPGLVFAPGSGEGISSRRTSGDNQFGLDFYTGSNRRFSIGLGGRMDLHDNPLFLRGTADSNHGLGYRSTFATHNVDGPALYGYAGGALGTTEGGENWSLRWDKNEVKVKVLTITGGMDLAEPFTMKEEAIEPGSVVVIDDEHPGRLKLSGQAYDTRVAGIVSGAGGVKPGIALHQEGIQEGGQNVALSGRVYVKADASHGAIRPGDLLTTSERSGHAMKVGESGRAQGAILGKAMTALEDGTGLVLVLVTLQ